MKDNKVSRSNINFIRNVRCKTEHTNKNNHNVFNHVGNITLQLQQLGKDIELIKHPMIKSGVRNDKDLNQDRIK